MDKKLKQAGLRSLAKTAGEIAEAAIRKEFTSISTALQSEIEYGKIGDQLELLDTIAYRVYEETVDATRDLLKRLKDLELTYHEIPGYSAEELRKYQNNYTLMARVFEILEHIRYHQISEILDIFFDYSCYEEESVSNCAKRGIEKVAAYNLDIFYGDGKDWPGLGWKPQEKVLEKIASFDEAQKQKYFAAIIIACEQILSPAISGSRSTYNTITWRTGALPAKEGVKEIRKKGLDELQHIYALANNVEQKKTILNAMITATRTPHMGEYGDDVLAMIIESSIIVAEFMKSVVVSDDMQVLQKIEHDAYWLFYHKGELDETIRKITLEIRDVLYANEEYEKFRILIGFESIFQDWEKDGNAGEDYNRERKFREKKALNLAETIDSDSYNEWKDRIIRFASIKSNDMATFPYFVKFLEHFGKKSPAIALQLLSETSDQLENSIIAILCGIEETEHKGDVYALIGDWCDEGKYLPSLARFFEFSQEVNENLLKKIFDKAVASNDLKTLNQIISSISAQYNETNKHLVKTFFLPVLEKLTTQKNTDWIFGIWFRKQRSDMLTDMGITEHKAILDNLHWLQKVDYQAEEILSVIAKQSPELVIQFFCNRLSKEKVKEDEGRYDAIPFSFHKLSEPLSQYPAQVIDAVLDIYDGNYGLFIYRGALLLKNIFPNFPPEFQEKLLEVVQSKEEKSLLFVMAILRNYDGDPIIHNICKEIVKILPDDRNLVDELSIILESTGVVDGEYGYVEAYEKKIEEIQPWLQDESPKIREFTQNYIANLEKRIKNGRRHAYENVSLRKYLYGSGEN